MPSTLLVQSHLPPRCILIFRSKYFSLKCFSIPTGKQNTLISNKKSDLSTSHLKVCSSQICSLKDIALW